MKWIYILVGVGLSFTLTAQSGKNCIPESDTLDGMEVLKIVDRPPEYEGGMEQFYKDVLRILKYSKSKPLSTKFIYTFVIDVNGNIRNFCLIKPENESLIDLEMLEGINHWTPGSLKGELVPVRMIIPVIVDFN